MKKKYLFFLLLTLSTGLLFVTCSNPAAGSDDNSGGGNTNIPDDTGTGGDDGDSGDDISDIPLQEPQGLWDTESQLALSDATGFVGTALAVSRDGSTIAARRMTEVETAGGGTAYPYGAVIVFRRSGDIWTETVLNPPVDASAMDLEIGTELALSDDGSVLAVGTRTDVLTYPEDGEISSGSVYIYTREGENTWSADPTLIRPTTPQKNLHFGHSVSLSGDGSILVVGAPKFDANDPTPDYENDPGVSMGKAYIYQNTDGSWGQAPQEILAVDDPAVHQERLNFFGYSVSISNSGDTLAVGAPGDQVSGSPHAGSAYLFTRSGDSWTRGSQITPLNETHRSYDYFGTSVALSANGSSLAVGAHRDNDRGQDSGSVYLYDVTGGTGTQRTKFRSYNGGNRSDYYLMGVSLDIADDGNTVAAGQPMTENDSTIIPPGRASVLALQDGGVIAEDPLSADDGTNHDSFGYAVGISGDRSLVVVAAPSLGSQSRSGIYLYE